MLRVEADAARDLFGLEHLAQALGAVEVRRGRAAHAEAFRELHLRDAGAVRYRAVEDQPPQMLMERTVALIRLDGVERDTGAAATLPRHSGQCMQLTTMRRIDIHCHPNTAEWFNAINPYAEALRTYWHRPWPPVSEQKVHAALPGKAAPVVMAA